jgi:dipeptidyl aminopeptidase/acylaminoacyl peptidase
MKASYLAAGLTRLALALVVAAPLASTAADPPTQPPIESFFRHPRMSDPELSPSGKLLALAMVGTNGRVRLGVLDLETRDKIRIVAGFEDADIRRYAWVNDKRLVFDTIDFSSAGGGQWAPGLFAQDIDGGPLRRLVRPADNEFNTGTRIQARQLQWNHRLHSTIQDGSADVIVERLDYRAMELDRTTLFRLNTETGSTSLVVSGLPEDGSRWVVDDQGRARVMTAVNGNRARIYWRDLKSETWQLVAETENRYADMPMEPYAVDGGDTIYVHAKTGNKDLTKGLFRFDAAGKKLESSPLVSIDGFDFEGRLVFDEGRKRLLGVHYVSDARGTVWFDARLRHLQERIDALLPSTLNRVSCRRCDEAPYLIVESLSDRQPAVYRVYDVKQDKLQMIGPSRPWIAAKDMSARSFTRITARDGLGIPVHVTTPQVGKKPWPAVVLVHGGPYVRGGDWSWDAESQFLASRGYLVIEPEFRGSAGYGDKHLRAGFKQWGLAMQDDVADAALWAVKEGLADKSRICIAGASYGGYSTLMGLLRDPELYRCGVNWVGVTDIELMYSLHWSDLSAAWKQYGLPILVGDRQKDAAQLAATSPLKHASRIRQPILMAYGEADRRVPIAHGRLFRDEVAKTNPNVQWIEYADEGHGFLLEKNNIDFWGRVERFLEKNLRPSPDAAAVKP